VAIFVDTCLQEMLGYDKTILQEIGGLEECRVFYQTREVAMHPSFGLPIDGLQTDVMATGKAATFSGNNPL